MSSVNHGQSFVTEVLATAGRLEKEDLNVKLNKLSKRIDEVKVEVTDALQKKYGDFYPNLNTTLQLSSKVNDMSAEMQAVSNKIEHEIKSQLNVSTTEFQDLSSQLEESNSILTILERLTKIHDALQAISEASKNKKYVQAATNLKIIYQLLKMSVNDHRENEIKILSVLHTEYTIQREQLISDLKETWVGNVKWYLSENAKKRSSAELQLSASKEIEAVLGHTVQAMADLNVLQPTLKAFGNQFVAHVVTPIVGKQSTVVKTEPSMQKLVLRVVVPQGELEPVAPSQVFGRLNMVFELLHKELLSLGVKQEDGQTWSLMKLLGKIIAEEVLEFIIKECLCHSIPTSNKELESYKEVVSVTEKFQSSLAKLQFIDEDNQTLTNYVGNVNVLFANKKCQEILQKAREMMTSEIHNTVFISDTTSSDDISLHGESSLSKKAKTTENTALVCDTKLSPSTFRLPSCHVSVFVQKLMKLTYETLHEAISSSPQCAIQLFYTIRNVFELYCSVVPTYHKDSLSKLPQLAAVHHNNCMYIAHHLLTLGHQFRHKLPEPLSQGTATFVDLVPKFRRLGTQCFIAQMTTQKSQLIESLSGAHGFSNVAEDDHFTAAERAIKQALHQLQHLSNVWVVVLPASIYCKSIGTLLNAVLVEVINSVVVLEDISADDATQLHSLLSMVTDKAPDFFHVEMEQSSPTALLYKNVAKWLKYKELLLMLNASLQDILDRWADSKGPLAVEFSANEVKQLVRALFQNTERRSAVLVKIR